MWLPNPKGRHIGLPLQRNKPPGHPKGWQLEMLSALFSSKYEMCTYGKKFIRAGRPGTEDFDLRLLKGPTIPHAEGIVFNLRGRSIGAVVGV